MFGAECKPEQIERVLRGEVTIGELSRELQISRNLLGRWKSLMSQAAETAVESNGDVVPASELKVAQQQIREPQRLLGKQAVELEILRAARDEVEKRPRSYGVSKK
jgi:transposase